MKEKLAILGYSDIARRRIIPGILKSERFVLVAIGSRRLAKDDFNEGIEVLSYEEVYTSVHIDTIYISTPPALHFENAMAALNYGKNAVIEKPAVLTVSELELLRKKASKEGLYFAEALSFEYNPIVPYLSDFYDSKYKDLKEINIVFRFPELDESNIRNSIKLGGGIANDALVYPLSLLQSLWREDGLEELLNIKPMISYNNYGVTSGVYYAFRKAHITYKIMVGMGFPYKNSVEFLTGDSTYIVPKLFSLKPLEAGKILKNETTYKDFEVCDQVTLMFNNLRSKIERKGYYSRLETRISILEQINSIPR